MEITNPKLFEKCKNLVARMSEYQIEEYCSRGSVWWESSDEWALRRNQERHAAEALYKELLESLKD